MKQAKTLLIVDKQNFQKNKMRVTRFETKNIRAKCSGDTEDAAWKKWPPNLFFHCFYWLISRKPAGTDKIETRQSLTLRGAAGPELERWPATRRKTSFNYLGQWMPALTPKQFFEIQVKSYFFLLSLIELPRAARFYFSIFLKITSLEPREAWPSSLTSYFLEKTNP